MQNSRTSAWLQPAESPRDTRHASHRRSKEGECAPAPTHALAFRIAAKHAADAWPAAVPPPSAMPKLPLLYRT
jgi:hypothetical protein